MTESWTPEQYRQHIANPKKRAKYGSKKVAVDNVTFHSLKEAKRYGELWVLQSAGEITDLELQPTFQIEMAGKKIAKYSADFRYVKNGEVLIEDVKSKATRLKASYRLKKKLVEAQYSITILET